MKTEAQHSVSHSIHTVKTILAASDYSYQMFDMMKVKVSCDRDILGRVNPRSHFRHVVSKQVREQLAFTDLG